MKICILKEKKNNEKRTPLIPLDIKKILFKHPSWSFYIEPSNYRIIPNNEWFMLSIRFCAYESYPFEEMTNLPRRKGKLNFYVNGLLKFSIDDLSTDETASELLKKQSGISFPLIYNLPFDLSLFVN